MANENSAQQTGIKASDLKLPKPPDLAKAQQINDSSPSQKVEQTPSEETVINNNADKKPDAKVQSHDWNNGKPEVKKELEPKLNTHKSEAHQTADQKNDEDLRKNKGNKEGEPVLEASEEVNTGQNSG